MNINKGLISVDTKGIITYINRSAGVITGWHDSAALGQHINDVLRVIRPINETGADALFHSVQGYCASNCLKEPITIRTKNGFARHIRINVSTVKDAENKNTGIIIIIENA